MHSYIKSLSNTVYIKTCSSFKAVQFRIEYQISVLNFKRISNSVLEIAKSNLSWKRSSFKKHCVPSTVVPKENKMNVFFELFCF